RRQHVSLREEFSVRPVFLFEREMFDSAAPAFFDPLDFAKFLDVTVHTDPAQSGRERETGLRISIRATPVCALVDPCTQDADLVRGERRRFAWRRHFAVFD